MAATPGVMPTAPPRASGSGSRPIMASPRPTSSSATLRAQAARTTSSALPGLLRTPENMELLTPRLRLREFEVDDWRATWPYESDPEVVRYTSHGVRTPEESRKYIEDSMATALESP